jgi:hypothetical protein
LLAPALHAQTLSLVTVGGNASINLIQDRLTNSVGGILPNGALTFNSTNKLIFRATGFWGSTNVTWDFNLTGGAAAVLDIANQNHVVLYNNSTAVPQNAVSVVAPETVGIDSAGLGLQQDGPTLVAPLVYVANSSLNGIVTNITARQAYLLEEAHGLVPTSFFGGTSPNPLYFVGRNASSAVRQVFDATLGFVDTAYNYTTNASGQPIVWAGATSGSQVASIIKVIPNSVGTVAAQDISGLPVLNYEGVAFSTTSVTNGSYPVWGYERYIYFPTGDVRAPSAPQQAIITALESAVADPTYDHTSPLFVNKFVSFADVNAHVSRDPTLDGSLIVPGPVNLPLP